MNSIVDDYVKCGNEFEKKLYDNTIDYFKQKKGTDLDPCHAHQAIGNMGGRGKCPRYY